MRLFVTAWPSAEVRDVLRAMPRPERPGVRWSPEERWHATLRFLGEVDDPEAVTAALRAEVAGSGPVEARLAGATSVLARGVVVGVDGLDRLAGRAAAATAGLGAGDAEAERGFVGHVTLARCRSVPADLVGVPVPGAAEARWVVDRVAVVRSTPGPPGEPHTYDELASVPLT